MIQAIGLTSLPRRHQLRPAVDDLTFEAAPGGVTVLLGSESSGKTTALRLMLQLQTGRGTALFRGRPAHRIQHLAREVGVLLGEVNGHPGRTARGHLRMLAAAAGVPAGRADEVLDVVGLSGLADQRMSTLSRGMDRRLGMACALLGDPHTLVLDEPASELSPRETAWLYSLVRGYAHQGGTVLVTSRKSEEAAQLADRVVSIDSGRLVADQQAADFVRTRLRPRVAVRTPHAERLTAVLTQEGRKAGRDRDQGPLKVVREDGTKVSVYGSSCAEVGEWAHRNGILVHQLTDERGDAGDAHTRLPLERADGRSRPAPAHTHEAEGSPRPDGTRKARKAPAAEQVQLEPEELEELAKFEEDAATAPPADADPDVGPPNSRAAAKSSKQPPETQPKPPPPVPAEPGGPGESAEAPAAELEADRPAAERPHPRPGSAPARTAAPAPAPKADRGTNAADGLVPDEDVDVEPVLVSSSVQPPPPSTATPGGRAASAAHDATSTAPDAQTVRISDTPLDVSAPGVPATGSASKSDDATPPVPADSRARALLKPLVDPDARPKLKSLWTPEPSAAPASAPAELPPQIQVLPRPGPAAPLRYELCRLFSVRSTWIALVVTVMSALCVSLVMARTGIGLPSRSEGALAPAVRLLTGWPSAGVFLLPPAAVASGLLGAFAFGEEFRYPALSAVRSPAARRLSLLAAKLAVSASLAVLLSVVVALVNAAGVTLFFGSRALALPDGIPSLASAPGDGSWRLHVVAVFALAAGCAWAGVLAAGIFRSGAVGTAVVVAVPLLLAPLAGSLLGDPAAGASAAQSASHSASSSAGGAVSAGGFAERLEAALLVPWPPGTERWVAAVLELVSQPVGCALALSLAALLSGYLVVSLNGRAR